MFVIPYTIRSIEIQRVKCDLGASFIVMSYCLHSCLRVGSLKEIGVMIQLVDRSLVYLKGVLQDVLVTVKSLIFLADFYVLDISSSDISTNSI